MCKSAAEGGQRCHTHTAKALTIAESRYQALQIQARAFQHNGQPIPAELRAKGLRAQYDLADARARYASTPQGETNLAALMDRELTIERGLTPPELDNTGDPTVYHAYAAAISEGRRLRARAKETCDAVRSGTITGEQAAALTLYPSAELADHRDLHITRITQEETRSQHPTSTGPAAPPAAPATQRNLVRKAVKYMQVGDRLSSGAVIVTAPSRGMRTPAGKHEIGVKYPNGTTKRATWGSNTLIAVTPITVTPARTDPPPVQGPPAPTRTAAQELDRRHDAALAYWREDNPEGTESEFEQTQNLLENNARALRENTRSPRAVVTGPGNPHRPNPAESYDDDLLRAAVTNSR